MWKYNDKIIREGRSWVDSDGVTHPTSWGRWTDEEKTAAGLVWEDDPAPFDNRFWWDADTPKGLDDVNEVDENNNPLVDEDGEQVVTLGLKSVWKNTIKQQAAGKLAPTDWMVIKATEVADYSVDQTTLSYRASVRAASNTIEASIDGAADHAAFVALFVWPTDADGNITGVAPIADWPEEL